MSSRLALQTSFRMTRQRQVILEALRRSLDHLTGDEVYRLARRRLPHISLGTVYRNLDSLVEEGTLKRVEMGHSESRFDVCLSPHSHIECISCGRIDDVALPEDSVIMQSPVRLAGYEVTERRTMFRGLCPACQAKSGENN